MGDAIGPEGNGTVRACRVGEEVEVRLPSNPTTGYAWRLAGPPADVAVRETRLVSVRGAVGAGSTQVFHAVPLAPGRHELSWRLSREWDPAASGGAFTVTLDVR